MQKKSKKLKTIIMQNSKIEKKNKKFRLVRNINGRKIQQDWRDTISEVLDDAMEIGVLKELDGAII